MRDYFFKRRRLFRFSLNFAFELIERNKVIDLRGAAATAHLKIAQNDGALSILREKDKRVARPKLCRVKHIGVDVAWRDNESRHSIFGVLHGDPNCRASAPLANYVRRTSSCRRKM